MNTAAPAGTVLALLTLLAALALPGPARAEPSASGPSCAAESPLDLAGALDQVQRRYPTVDGALAAIEEARARTVEQGSVRLPQLAAGASYQYDSIRPYVALSLPGLPPGRIYESVQDSFGATLTLREQLSDFGRTAALVALARSGEASARDTLEAVRRQLGYTTIQTFYGVLLLGESARVADDEITALQEALRISQRRFAAGSATRFDVLTTQVRLANAGNKRTDIQGSLDRERAALRRLLGRAPGTGLPLSGDFDTSRPAPDLATALAEGLDQRPDARLARDAESAALLRLDAADRERRPVLDAQATAGVDNGEVPYLYDKRGYVTGGLSVSVPLFTGNRITGDRLEAGAALRRARAGLEEIRGIIGDDVESALADLEAARAHLANADTLVDQAREALALAQTRYANGVVTNFELLDAQSAARAAELSRLQARYDCVLAWHSLARAAGRPPQA